MIICCLLQYVRVAPRRTCKTTGPILQPNKFCRKDNLGTLYQNCLVRHSQVWRRRRESHPICLKSSSPGRLEAAFGPQQASRLLEADRMG